MNHTEVRKEIRNRINQIDEALKSAPQGSLQREWLWEDRTRCYAELDELDGRYDDH